MKKFLLLIAIAVYAMSSSAQKMFTWGLEGGMNFNSLSFSSEMFKSTNRAGFFVGPKLKARIPIVGLGADASLLYSMNSVAVVTSGVDKTKSLSYLEIPMNVRYSFGLFKVLSMYLATGPQFNYCMSSDKTIAEFYGSANYISRSTWGWNVGGGFEIASHFQVGVTYTIPISNTGEFTAKDIDFKQKTVKVRLAYFF